MKASPLTAFLAILTVLFVVIPGIIALFFPVHGSGRLLTPTGMFTHTQKANDTTENVFFGIITPSMKPSEITIVIESFSWGAEYAMPSNDLSGPLTLVHTFGSSYSDNITSIFYTDLGQIEEVGTGDYITITLSHEGSGSEVYGVWMAYTLGITTMDDIFFTW
jgi:hypothetical protein